jgi:hypothetical protein
MEALPWSASGSPEPLRDIPSAAGGYLAQLDMRRLMTMALQLAGACGAMRPSSIRAKTRRNSAAWNSPTGVNESGPATYASYGPLHQQNRSLSGAGIATLAASRTAIGCRWATTSLSCQISSNLRSTRP